MKKSGNVKITRVQVKNLFNLYNYDLKLKKDDNIGILIAPNGCGKTTIFNFIEFILKCDETSFNKIKKVPFDEFICYFSNDTFIKLERQKGVMPVLNEKNLRRTFARERLMERKIELFGENVTEIYYITGSTTKGQLKEIKRKGLLNLVGSRNRHMHLDIDNILNDVDELSENDYDALEFDYNSRNWGYILSFVKKMIVPSFVPNVCFITANRIKETNNVDEELIRERRHFRSIETTVKSALDEMVDNLNKIIDDKYKEYSDAVNISKDNIVNRCLKIKINSEVDNNVIKQTFDKYKNEYNEYRNIGLIDAPLKINIENFDNLADYQKEILMISIQEFTKTLEPLRDLYQKVKLFSDIINERNQMSRKRIVFTNKEFNMLVNDNKLSDINCLSSGEKNDLLMFYKLIFEASDNDLVLIDEPEISLHITWQKTFLDKLLEINAINSKQIIIATHSPHIIGNHINLLVDREMEYVE